MKAGSYPAVVPVCPRNRRVTRALWKYRGGAARQIGQPLSSPLRPPSPRPMAPPGRSALARKRDQGAVEVQGVVVAPDRPAALEPLAAAEPQPDGPAVQQRHRRDEEPGHDRPRPSAARGRPHAAGPGAPGRGKAAPPPTGGLTRL